MSLTLSALICKLHQLFWKFAILSDNKLSGYLLMSLLAQSLHIYHAYNFTVSVTQTVIVLKIPS